MHPFSNKRLIFVLLALMWAQISLISLIAIKGIKPDLFYIFLSFYALKIDWKRIVPAAFFVGLLRDLISNSFFGIETTAFVASALILQFFVTQFDREKKWIQLTSLFTFSWVNLILFFALSFFTTGHYDFLNQLWIRTFFISTYTTVLGFILFPILEEWLKSILYEKQYELF